MIHRKWFKLFILFYETNYLNDINKVCHWHTAFQATHAKHNLKSVFLNLFVFYFMSSELIRSERFLSQIIDQNSYYKTIRKISWCKLQISIHQRHINMETRILHPLNSPCLHLPTNCQHLKLTDRVNFMCYWVFSYVW